MFRKTRDESFSRGATLFEAEIRQLPLNQLTPGFVRPLLSNYCSKRKPSECVSLSFFKEMLSATAFHLFLNSKLNYFLHHKQHIPFIYSLIIRTYSNFVKYVLSIIYDFSNCFFNACTLFNDTPISLTAWPVIISFSPSKGWRKSKVENWTALDDVIRLWSFTLIKYKPPELSLPSLCPSINFLLNMLKDY